MPETQQEKTLRRLHVLMSHLISNEEHINFASLISGGAGRWIKYLPGLHIPDDWQDTKEFVEILENIASHFNRFLIEQYRAGKVNGWKFIGNPKTDAQNFGVQVFKKHTAEYTLPPIKNAQSYNQPIAQPVMHRHINRHSFFEQQQRETALQKHSFFNEILKLLSTMPGRSLHIVDDILLHKIPINWDNVISPYPPDWNDSMLPRITLQIAEDLWNFLEMAKKAGNIQDYKFDGNPLRDPDNFQLLVMSNEHFAIRPGL